jgi:hypothetical protein
MKRLAVAFVGAALGMLLVASIAGARVLLVGKYRGIHGQYSTIQAAVNAARPGDWILIGPGDYKTIASYEPRGRRDTPAAVLISKRGIHLRGMNRNTVIIDGTKPGSRVCSRRTSDQNFGPRSRKGRLGLNGILIWKAANVWVQNLTACNFLGGGGDAGNEIWWNGGDGSGKIGGHAYYGSYLTTTSSYFRGEKHAAQYGVFSSNWRGGTWDQIYGSNFNDSAFYIGACQIQCFQTINHAWAQWNALGYSGTNSGGPLLIENSQFDHNAFGVDTNSQNNSDWPSPQSGRCPPAAKPPVAGAHSCWVLYKNYIHDNNNPNVPSAGSAAAGPVGTGASIEGRDDTLMKNVFKNNGAWGAVFQWYPDTGTPPRNAVPCVGGLRNFKVLGINIKCLYDDWNDALISNTFTHNGFFGNPTNGDFAQSTYTAGHPIN